MSPEVILALGTTIAAIIAAITSLVVALIGLRTKRAVDEVHTLVNSTHTATMVREEVLIAALQAGGVKIPEDESLKEE